METGWSLCGNLCRWEQITFNQKRINNTNKYRCNDLKTIDQTSTFFITKLSFVLRFFSRVSSFNVSGSLLECHCYLSPVLLWLVAATCVAAVYENPKMNRKLFSHINNWIKHLKCCATEHQTMWSMWSNHNTITFTWHRI